MATPSISSRPSASTMRQPLRARDRERRRHRLHLCVGQPDVVETGRVPVGRRCFRYRRHLRFLSAWRHSQGYYRTNMPSLDDFARHKLATLEREHLHRVLIRPRATTTSGSSVGSGGCYRSAATIISGSAIIRLSRPRQSRPSSATASAPAPRGSSPATTRSMKSWSGGWRSSKAPPRPACSGRAISPTPGSPQCWSGATI